MSDCTCGCQLACTDRPFCIRHDHEQPVCIACCYTD